MSFANEAESKLSRLMVSNRNSSFAKLEKSNRGEEVVIKFLEHLQQPASPKMLAEALHLSSARIATILGGLEKKELITRTISSKDRRRITVTLTEKGQQFASQKAKEATARIVQIFEQMGEEDTNRFVELIEEFFYYSQKITDEEEGNQA